MGKNIVIESLQQTPIEQQYVEIVERKGIGHPDSVADGLAESVSRALCRMYLDHYGRVLHHNTDETQIVGGQAHAEFGGGEVLEPVYILLVGRAVTKVGNDRLPYRTVALGAAREYLRQNFKHLDVDLDVSLDCRIGQGSQDLRALYESLELLANDTSFGIGYAPLSQTEQVVLNVSNYINGPVRDADPAYGEDIKVMAVRRGDVIELTIAVALVSSHVDDSDHYASLKEELRDKVLDFSSRFTEKEVIANINTADNPSKNLYYLTVTGLSMENGDDGSVGRGNRVNGLISPGRPMSMEASAGKNPVTHVGKLYNLLAHIISKDIIDECGGDVVEAHVRILSQIGRRITDPLVASAQLIMAPGSDLSGVRSDVEGIFEERLDNIDALTQMIVSGKVSVF